MHYDYICMACNREFVAEHGIAERPNVPCIHCKSTQTIIAGGGNNVTVSILFSLFGLIIGLFIQAVGLYLIAFIVSYGDFSTAPKGYVYAKTGSRTSGAFGLILMFAFLASIAAVGWLADRCAAKIGNWFATLLKIRFKSHYVDCAGTAAAFGAALFLMLVAFLLFITNRLDTFLLFVGLRS
jgi:hypothetical protein